MQLEVNLDELPKATGVIIPEGLRIPKGLQHWVRV